MSTSLAIGCRPSTPLGVLLSMNRRRRILLSSRSGPVSTRSPSIGSGRYLPAVGGSTGRTAHERGRVGSLGPDDQARRAAPLHDRSAQASFGRACGEGRELGTCSSLSTETGSRLSRHGNSDPCAPALYQRPPWVIKLQDDLLGFAVTDSRDHYRCDALVASRMHSY